MVLNVPESFEDICKVSIKSIRFTTREGLSLDPEELSERDIDVSGESSILLVQ